ncbi:MAG: DUF1646 family protein [Candidatus Nitrosocaldus sp.]
MVLDGIAVHIATLTALIAVPVLSKKVEHNIEYFFLAVGVIMISVVGLWSPHLLEDALLHPVMIGNIPIGITQVVLVAGLIFYYNKDRVARFAFRLNNPLMLAGLVFILGIASSIISAIVASAILAELLALSQFPRNVKAKVAIASAFAIGIGALLLPLGEPLSTIAIAKLKGEPYNATFTFLLENLWDLVIPLVALFSILAYFYAKRSSKEAYIAEYESSVKEVVMRTVRIYAFIFGLTLLGEFFVPLAEPVSALGIMVLYFFGLISAAADNATLTAALVSPEMELSEIRAFMISLVISGGLLIPGNVPNIIFANILKIGFKEWARLAIPVGMVVFLIAGAAIIGLGL